MPGKSLQTSQSGRDGFPHCNKALSAVGYVPGTAALGRSRCTRLSAQPPGPPCFGQGSAGTQNTHLPAQEVSEPPTRREGTAGAFRISPCSSHCVMGQPLRHQEWCPSDAGDDIQGGPRPRFGSWISTCPPDHSFSCQGYSREEH